MRVYDVDEGYVPSQAVLEVLDFLDKNDEELKEAGKVEDPYSKELREKMKDEELDFSNSTSPTGDVD